MRCVLYGGIEAHSFVRGEYASLHVLSAQITLSWSRVHHCFAEIVTPLYNHPACAYNFLIILCFRLPHAHFSATRYGEVP